MISDARARHIASEWHSGNDATYVFTSTGAIDQRVRTSFYALLEAHPSETDLRDLITYLAAHSDRKPVPGWGSLWEDTPLLVTDTEFPELWCPACREYTTAVYQDALWRRRQKGSLHPLPTFAADHPSVYAGRPFIIDDWEDAGELEFAKHLDWLYGCCERVIEFATQVEALDKADGR